MTSPTSSWIRGLLAAAALAVLAAAGTARAQAEAPRYQWRLEATQDGCQTFVSEIAGRKYVAARTECVLAVEKARIGPVLRDIAAFPGWMHDCKETKLLQVVDRDRDVYVFWFRQHIPFLTDRDVVLRSEARLSSDRDVIVASATREVGYDSGKGYVRMPAFTSEWVIEAVDAQHTRVSFMIDPDLGDGLPGGVANGKIRETPLRSIQGLARLLRAGR
jgi:hypothetical protein